MLMPVRVSLFRALVYDVQKVGCAHYFCWPFLHADGVFVRGCMRLCMYVCTVYVCVRVCSLLPGVGRRWAYNCLHMFARDTYIGACTVQYNNAIRSGGYGFILEHIPFLVIV